MFFKDMALFNKKGGLIKMALSFAIFLGAVIFALGWLLKHPEQKELLFQIVGAFTGR